MNNATARVVTKKPQTPLVNGEITGETPSWLLFESELNWIQMEASLNPASGWKLNPVMGAMYAPELYTGTVSALFWLLSSLLDSYLIFSCFSSGQFPISCRNSHPGIPGICPTRSGTSRLQRHSLCSRARCRPSIPWVRPCYSALRSLFLISVIFFLSVVYQDGLYGAEVYVRPFFTHLHHVKH